jgi:hypothetical protein
MTPAQKARLTGFNVSLRLRGVWLKLLPDGPSYNALVQDAESDRADFSLSQETRASSLVHILRSHLGSQQIVPGDTLKNEATGAHYRVTEQKIRPSDIALVLPCESVLR